MSKKNILVFPCGSEVALEIHRSLEYSIHFNLIGANSVSDHGKFIFNNYIDGIPFVSEKDFIPKLKSIVAQHEIDAIYPAMDSVITKLKQYETELGCKVISSDLITTEISLNKELTYDALKTAVSVPKVYHDLNEINEYPVFIKPKIGYGSRGVAKCNSVEDVAYHLKKYDNLIITEYLPGKEYTVDCFTNYKGELLFVGARERIRVSNGISVNTRSMVSNHDFDEFAHKINSSLRFRGAWFFQLKARNNGDLVLMEVASRIGGSSSTYRAKGINFASLSVFDAFDFEVGIIENKYEVEVDRALTNKYKLDIEFENAYIDFDDTLIIDQHVNTKLISVIYKFINEGKKVHLITKHINNLSESLIKYRMDNLFDSIIHLKPEDTKSNFITEENSIFIDDSFAERKSVKENLNLPVFSVDMVELFL